MNWKTAPNYENKMFMAFSRIRNTAQNLSYCHKQENYTKPQYCNVLTKWIFSKTKKVIAYNLLLYNKGSNLNMSHRLCKHFVSLARFCP